MLEGTRWKPRIRRWKVVISRPDAGCRREADSPRRVVEPGPVEDEKDAGAAPALERDLIPGEVRLKLAIDPSGPGSIEVRIEPDPEKVRAGRDDRAVAAGRAQEGHAQGQGRQERDPLEYRRARLRKLREDGAKDRDEIEALEQEIAELERRSTRSAGPRTCSPVRRASS